MAPSSGRSCEQEAESCCFLSSRWRRGRTLWRNRSFLSFTCRKGHRHRYWAQCSCSVISSFFFHAAIKLCICGGEDCDFTRSTEDPKEYFRLTRHPVSTPKGVTHIKKAIVGHFGSNSTNWLTCLLITSSYAKNLIITRWLPQLKDGAVINEQQLKFRP